MLRSLMVMGWLLLPLALSAQRPGDEPFSIQRIRGDDDWIAAADPEVLAAQPGGKAIVLGDRSFLSVGGEWRLTLEHFQDESWGDEPGADGYRLDKIMVHGAWTLLPKAGPLEALRVFAQLKHGEVYQRSGEPRPPDVDRLDWNAAFLEMRSRRIAGGRLTLRIGRQELHYGAGRLISVREGPNTRSSFDAALVRWQSLNWKTDLFHARPYSTAPGSFDNQRLPDRELWGVYATRPASDASAVGLELFAFRDERPQTYFRGPGSERRYSIGSRASQRRGRLEQDVLVVWQWGEWQRIDVTAEGADAGDIEAWTLSTNTSYLLAPEGWRPRAHLFFGYVTGDREIRDAAVEAFRAPYPPGRYFGAGVPMGPMNVIFYRLGVSVQAPSGLELGLGAYDFYRESREDGLYDVPGNPLRDPEISDARHIGHLLELTVAHPVGFSTRIEVEVAHFFTGAYLTADADTTVFSARLVLRY